MGTIGYIGGCGDNVGTMGTMWGRCGDDLDRVGRTGMTWQQSGDHRDHKSLKMQ